ncbi:hypothetical protein A2U01_0119040, partial [Trifolium medium]|nr:hypothetical protein [Trifolium medium]
PLSRTDGGKQPAAGVWAKPSRRAIRPGNRRRSDEHGS